MDSIKGNKGWHLFLKLTSRAAISEQCDKSGWKKWKKRDRKQQLGYAQIVTMWPQ